MLAESKARIKLNAIDSTNPWKALIALGMWADLVVFDQAGVADTATFQAPHSYAVGIPHVVVNGVPVIKDGQFSGATPGRLLRSFDG